MRGIEPTAHANMLTVPMRSSLGGRLVTSLVASDTCDPLGNWLVVDAGKTRVHQTTARELPVFITEGAKPITGVIVPFIGKAHGDPVVFERKAN